MSSTDALDASDKKSESWNKNRRIIGFHTRTGWNEEQTYMTIRSIAPIFDKDNCDIATINQDPEKHVVKLS